MSSSLRIHYAEESASDSFEALYEDCHQYNDEPLKLPFEGLTRLLDHVQDLKETISALRQSPPGTRIESPHVQSELSYAENSADELQDFLDACWEQIPVARRPSARSAVKAQEVFNTPELLENIIIHLGTKDVLSAQQVGRVWRDGVNGSVKILRSIGIYPQEDVHFKSPFERLQSPDSFWGLNLRTESEDFDHHAALQDGVIPRTQKVRLDIGAPTSTSLFIGPRCRAISICQPPLKRATMSFSCYCSACLGNNGRFPRHEFDMTSEEAITVGDVMDAAQQIYGGRWMLKEEPVPRRYNCLVQGGTSSRWEFETLMVETDPHNDFRISLRGEVTLADHDPEMDRRRHLVECAAKYPNGSPDWC